MRHIALFSCYLLLILTFISSCTEKETSSKDIELVTSAENHLGEIDFKVTGSAEAIPHFEEGLLLLHSFEYEDAREAFLKAQDLDTTFAMAYWGEAMTHNHALWQQQDLEKAVEALKKLAPNKEARKALVSTEMEQDFFEGAEILFGAGTKYERDIAYKNYMEKLTEKYPNHHEVSAFYAISLLGAARNGRDEVLYNKSARVAKGIMAENPNHPGALHYLIHSYDDPDHASMAKEAADQYAKVAPDAAHALHMPSHIYVALGNWNDVVTSNIASWNASVKRMEHKNLGVDAKSYHALNWLQYGLLQRGEYDKASQLMDNMVSYLAEDDGKRARSYALTMKGAHMVENNSWEGQIADLEIDVADLNISDRAAYAFLEAMKAYHKKDAKTMKGIAKTMSQARQTASALVGDQGFAMCSAAGSSNTSQLDISQAHILEMEVRAYLADLNGDVAAANEWFEKGIALEETLDYSFGPPIVFKPVHEAYGEYLLKQNKAEQALSVFEKALEVNPRRFHALKGKKQAANLVGNQALQTAAEEELAVSMKEEERGVIL